MKYLFSKLNKIYKVTMIFKFRLMFIIFLVPQCVWSSGHCPNLKTDVKSIRKRRHLVFPDGSNFVLTMDFAKAFQTHAPSGWYVTMDLDVVYLLPDKKFISSHLRRKLHHRQKREFWERIRDALNLHNMNGHACLLRSICEAKTHLAPPGKSLVHDVLRAIFTAPLEEIEFAEEMQDIYNDLSDPNICEQNKACPFSIINFILSFNKKI